MRYLLVVVTHGDNTYCLPQTVTAFNAHATPAPVATLLMKDGDCDGIRVPPPRLVEIRNNTQQGFCVTTETAWRFAASWPNIDYVFWLEHDFLLTRPVDLTNLATLLHLDAKIAQVALMRNAVNHMEQAAGGLFESRRGEYTQDMFDTPETGLHGFLRHRSYFTTNPNLMRRDFMEQHPWPPYPDRCEGRFGADILNGGYQFAVWGDGEPWVEHIGVRDGFGY